MNKFNVKEFNEKLMGKRVRIRGGYIRVPKHDGERIVRSWVYVDHGLCTFGWLTGARWLQEGFTEYGDFDGPQHFVETGPRKLCYLFVADPRNKPIRVSPELVEVVKYEGI